MDMIMLKGLFIVLIPFLVSAVIMNWHLGRIATALEKIQKREE